MKVTLESTSKVVELNGTPARIWEGTTERGVPVFAFITRIAPAIENPPPDVCAEFEADLMATRAPSAAISAAIPSRLVL
jgi:hypothetical protein